MVAMPESRTNPLPSQSQRGALRSAKWVADPIVLAAGFSERALANARAPE